VEIRCDAVVSQYWTVGDSEPTARPATDPDGWLTTGDVGTLDDEGFLYLLARSDDVINRGGEKIYPGEIESVLLDDERVTGAVVVAKPDEIVGSVPAAFVTARVTPAEQAGLIDDLRRRCEVSLSGPKRPTAVAVVDILPAGPTGKVRRAELKRRLATW
jgi:oxalate---CoA ligase